MGVEAGAGVEVEAGTGVEVEAGTGVEVEAGAGVEVEAGAGVEAGTGEQAGAERVVQRSENFTGSTISPQISIMEEETQTVERGLNIQESSSIIERAAINRVNFNRNETSDVMAIVRGTEAFQSANVNAAPILKSTGATGVVTEKSTLDSLVDTGSIGFSDFDLSNTHNVSVGNVSAGALGSLVANVDQVNDNVDWTYTIADADVQYLAVGEIKLETFDVIIIDDGNGGTATQTVSVTITGTNDGPVATSSIVTATEDTTYTFSAEDFNFADVDDGDSLASVKITALETAGELTLDGSAVTTNQVILVADITGGLLKFAPAADANGGAYDAFEYNVNDGTVDSASSYTMTIDVNAVNDVTTMSNAPSDVTVVEDVSSDVNLSAMSFADVDGDNLTVTVAASEGTLGASSAGGVTITDSGTGALTLEGSVAAINTYLDTTSNIQYTSEANVNGDNAATLTITSNDGTAAW